MSKLAKNVYKKKKVFRTRLKKKMKNDSSLKTGVGEDGNHKVLHPIAKIVSFANADELPTVAAAYAAICGQACPVSDLLASNVVASDTFAADLGGRLFRHLSEAPNAVAIRTQWLGSTSGSAPVVDIPALRKDMSSRDAAAITALRFLPVPDDADPSGFKVVTESVGIHFGVDAEAEIGRLGKRNRSRSAPDREAAKVRWIDAQNDEAVREAVALVAKPTFSLSILDENESGIVFPKNWNRDRALRAFVLLQAYAMLSFNKRIVASGAGKAILVGELKQAEYRLSEACKVGPSVVHRDGVPHFWFNELRRLGLDDLHVPLIKLH